MNATNISGDSPASCPYDALLLISFGGPEGPEDVLPFLENVSRGKQIPPERLQQVARRYELFDGVSPINGQNRVLLHALIGELNAHGPQLPVYWGNRNWHPMLADTVAEMAEDGVQKALAIVTSAFGSYPGCRQYREDIHHAQQQAGVNAPQIDKIRLFYNHPGFIEAMADRVTSALNEISAERRSGAHLIFSAHSLPVSMAERSPYERQVREACRLVTERYAGAGDGERGTGEWQLVFQSRSGPPTQPWLEPDICSSIRQLSAAGDVRDVVVVPLGFLAENLEIVYDLDVEVRELCEELGINMVRAPVVGSHPRFVRMIRELIVERTDPTAPHLALGSDGPWPEMCMADCCPPDTTKS